MAPDRQGKPEGSGKRKKILVGLLVIAGLVPLLRWAYWDTLGNRFTTLCAAHGVYHSAMLSAGELSRTVEKRSLRSVVDLRNEEGGLAPADEARILDGLGVRYFHLPSTQVPNLETVDRFLELSMDPDNFPMLIHCHHGEGRSVLFSALHRIEFDGWPIEDARKATRLFHFQGSFGPRGPKGRFMRSYKPRLEKSGADSHLPTRLSPTASQS